jgi:hypothetical protein
MHAGDGAFGRADHNSYSAICTTSRKGVPRRLVTVRVRRGLGLRDVSGQIPAAARDGAQRDERRAVAGCSRHHSPPPAAAAPGGGAGRRRDPPAPAPPCAGATRPPGVFSRWPRLLLVADQVLMSVMRTVSRAENHRTGHRSVDGRSAPGRMARCRLASLVPCGSPHGGRRRAAAASWAGDLRLRVDGRWYRRGAGQPRRAVDLGSGGA